MIDSRTAPYAAFVLRIALGTMFIAHAMLKYAVFTLPGCMTVYAVEGDASILRDPVRAFRRAWSKRAA